MLESSSHKYSYQSVEGHIIIKSADKNLLVDTGAPLSIGQGESVKFAGKKFLLQESLLGVTGGNLGEFIGDRIDALIGADILSQYEVLFDSEKKVVVFSESEIPLEGTILNMEEVSGIPIIWAEIGGVKTKMIVDTGAKLSYLESEIIKHYPPFGRIKDFYLGLGEFWVSISRVPITIGTHQLQLEFGELPDILSMLLQMTGAAGIFGTALLDEFIICFSWRRKKLALRRR